MVKVFISKRAEVNVIATRIKNFQKNPHFHPLNCKVNDGHILQPLIVSLNEEKDRHQLIMKCPKCNYSQDNIPSFLLHDD